MKSLQIGTQKQILPIYKSRDKRDCKNYRGITLTAIPDKVLAGIIRKRIRSIIDKTIIYRYTM